MGPRFFALIRSAANLPAEYHPTSDTTERSPFLARKPNYSFEKRKKEIDRKAKKDTRRANRLQRKQAAAGETESSTPPETTSPEGGVAQRP